MVVRGFGTTKFERLKFENPTVMLNSLVNVRQFLNCYLKVAEPLAEFQSERVEDYCSSEIETQAPNFSVLSRTGQHGKVSVSDISKMEFQFFQIITKHVLEEARSEAESQFQGQLLGPLRKHKVQRVPGKGIISLLRQEKCFDLSGRMTANLEAEDAIGFESVVNFLQFQVGTVA